MSIRTKSRLFELGTLSIIVGLILAAALTAQDTKKTTAPLDDREGPGVGRGPAVDARLQLYPQDGHQHPGDVAGSDLRSGPHRPGARLGRGPRLQRRPGLPPLPSLWEQDPGGFLRRLGRFLEIADRHHIGTMFVLFDDCWNPKFALGPQPAPRPGVHNSGWVQCPGPDLLEAPAAGGSSRSYTRGVVGLLPRATGASWPGTSTTSRGIPTTARSRCPSSRRSSTGPGRPRPSQPLTAGIWDDDRSLASPQSFPGR